MLCDISGSRPNHAIATWTHQWHDGCIAVAYSPLPSHFLRRRVSIMRSSYLAGVFSGFVGGLMGAYVLGHVERAIPLAAAAEATRQDVVTARRIRLVDASGRARAELAMSPDGGPGI